MKTESVFRPVVLLMSGRMFAFLATFFIPVVLARVFDPAEFGTYKQLFLIQSTVYLVAQLGMGTSLYYFLPKAPAEAGRYVANSLIFLGIAGLAGFGATVLAAPSIARWLSNNEIQRYLPSIGLYIFLTMLSTPLEVVLIARSRYLWASASYALSDLARAAAFVVPVLLFRDLEWLLRGAVMVAFLRAAVALFYFRREFQGSLRPSGSLLRTQLTYALPFAAAVLVEILQGSIPQYAVSHLFDPATFAIFAVGCLQIPLVEFAAGPTSDVMMVRMQESLVTGQPRRALQIWHDATWKLALLFVPLVALLLITAPQIIIGLFTKKYAASVPLFAVWTTMILLSTLQVDGVLRVYAQTRFLLALNLMRLLVIGSLIRWFLSEFQLLGAILVMVFATVLFKSAALVRIKNLLGVSLAELLPWRPLATLVGASAAAGAGAWLINSHLRLPPLPLLAVTAGVYTILFAALVWYTDLLQEDERRVLAAWLRKAGWIGKPAITFPPQLDCSEE